jgi:outer membrane protein assembly factor BamB
MSIRNVALFCSSLVLVCAAGHAGDVAQFRGDAQHMGVYAPDGPQGPAFVKWRFRTGNKVRSTPAVCGGTVFVGSNDGSLYALDEASGTQRWAFKTGGEVSSSPAVADGLVYFQSADGKFYAIDAKTGKQRWSFGIGEDLPFRNGVTPVEAGPPGYGLWDFFLSSPVVDDGTVYFGGGDGKLYALDARSGKQLWNFATAGRVRSTPAVAGGTVYFGSMDGNFFALDRKTGELKWKFKTVGNEYFPAGEIQSSPAVVDGTVYFGSRDYHVYALDAATGTQRWKTQHKDSWVVGSPAIADGLVFVGSSDGKFVQALDLKTGEEKWHEKTGGNVFSSAAVAGDVVYFADWDGMVLGRDTKTGRIVTGVLIEDRVNSSPVIDRGMLFFGGDDDFLYAVAAVPKAGANK